MKPPLHQTTKLVAGLNLCRVEKSSTVVQRQKVDLVLSNPIDNAIAAHNDLSDVFDSQLANNSP